MSYITFVTLNCKAHLYSEKAQGTAGHFLSERLHAEGDTGGRNCVTISDMTWFMYFTDTVEDKGQCIWMYTL